MFKKFMLMNAAGGLGDGGAGTGGDNGGNGADNGGGANNGGSNEYVGPAWAKEWEGVADLGAELLNDPSLKVFESPTALLKSYVHAQKQLGKKGTMIPDQNSTKEEWDQFYQKVGVPLEDTKYKEALKLPEKEANTLGDEFNGAFIKLAHESRVKPDQAQKMYDFFNSQVKSNQEKLSTEYSQKTQAELDALRDEWGAEAYGVKLTKAEAFLKETAGEDFVKFLGTTGLGKNVNMVKAFAAMADKYMSEGEIPNGNATYGQTISEIEKSVNQIMGDLKDPYYNPNHPDNKRRVDEVLAMNRKIDQLRSRK